MKLERLSERKEMSQKSSAAVRFEKILISVVVFIVLAGCRNAPSIFSFFDNQESKPVTEKDCALDKIGYAFSHAGNRNELDDLIELLPQENHSSKFIYEYYTKAYHAFKEYDCGYDVCVWFMDNAARYRSELNAAGFSPKDARKASELVPYFLITKCNCWDEGSTVDLCNKYLEKFPAGGVLSEHECVIICIKLYNQYKNGPWRSNQPAINTLEEIERLRKSYSLNFGENVKGNFQDFSDYLKDARNFCEWKRNKYPGPEYWFSFKEFPSNIPRL